MPSVANATDNGIIAIPSHHSGQATLDRILDILQKRGITLFALIDHSGEAEKAGMHMPFTKLLIFGNPKAGTPLMLASPGIAIDLPLKLLVSEDAHANASVSFNSADYLRQRHRLPAELMKNVAVIEAIATEAAASS